MTAAMILAAGLGTRLRPLTDELPKPLVPVGDAPALAQIQRRLAAHGVDRVLVNTHHLASAFAARSWPLPTEILHEPRILGTAGGVANARPRLDPEQPLLVWNGDILAEVDVSSLLDALPGAVASWCVAPRPPGQGTVGLDGRGRVVRLRQVDLGGEVRGGDFLGVQALSPGLLRSLPPEGCLVGDALAPMLERGAVIQAVEHRGPWEDIGSLPSYLEANLRWLGDRRDHRGPGAVAKAPLDRVILGAGAEVEGDAPLERVVLWPGARARGPLRGAVVTSGGRVVPVPEAGGARLPPEASGARRLPPEPLHVFGAKHGALVVEFDLAGGQVVHGADDADLLLFHHLLEDEASLDDGLDRSVDVDPCDALDKLVIFAGALGRVQDGFLLVDGGLELGEQLGEVSHLDVVAGALDRSAARVAEDDEELAPGDVAGELHAAEDVRVDGVSSDADREDVAEALVKDKLGGGAAVDAGEDGGERPLPIPGLVGLLEEIAVRQEVFHEPRVPLPQHLERLLRCRVRLNFSGVYLHGG
jgi:mannose-1-phosphate guanylyltransferase